MAKNRYLNTHFWKDYWVETLDPSEKLVFLYLLTNSEVNLAGVYEIRLREIAMDTGIEVETLKRILERFENAEKAFYKNGWMCIPNFLKHQKLNANMIKSVQNSLSLSPVWTYEIIRKALKGLGILSHLNSILIQSNFKENINSTSSNKKNDDENFDDDGVLKFFSETTGRKANKSDSETLQELRNFNISDIRIKVGIALSAQRSINAINSLQYCVGAIEETTQNLPDEKSLEGYLNHLVSSINKSRGLAKTV